MPLRVCPGRSCSGNAILNAILYAAGLPNSSGTVPSKPADVMNMSLGGPGYDSPTHPYNTAMQDAVDAGTLPVCAAGNDGKDTDVTFYAPCGFDACMCVSAISPNLSPAGFTNYGSHIDISAPGVQIWSTVLNDKYEAWQGTSMASPHVAGVAGLIKSLNSNLTPQELRDFLEQTSTDLGNPGRDDHFGVGFLNAFKAAEAVGEDAGVFGPKLGAVPSRIIYSKDAAYQELTIVNKGSDDINSLTWSVEYTTATTYEWLVFRPEAGFGTTASKLGVYVDKYHLNEGDHSAIITINGVHLQSGEAVEALTIPVTVTVAENEITYPLIHVEAIQDDIVVARTYTHYNEGYHYVLDGLNEGQSIQIRAGTDLDHDGEICDAEEKWCGTLGGLADPETVNILSGSYRADLRFDVSNFEEGYYNVPEIRNLNLPAQGSKDVVFSFDSHSSHPTQINAFYRENTSGAFIAIPASHFSTSLNTVFEINKTVTWKSHETLPLGNGSVEFMLTTSSIVGGRGLSQTATLSILNNSRPELSNLKIIPEDQSSYKRDIAITVDVREPDSELTSLALQYSLNGDNGPWRDAGSISGKISGIVSETAKLVWHSNYDFDTNQSGVKIKVIADDGKTEPRALIYPSNTFITIDNGPVVLSSWSNMPVKTGAATICTEADGAVHDDKLYAVCADLTSGSGGRISIFDFITNVWEVESNEISFNQSRSDYTSTLVNGKIYTYGGQNTNVAGNSIEALSASTNSLLQFDPTNNNVSTIKVKELLAEITQQ